MAAKKKAGTKKPSGGKTGSIRDNAEAQLALVPKCSADLKALTSEALVHELQVHQIELETQAEELRRAQLALEESRDKYLDLYEFAPLGYITLNDKALITESNLTGAMLLGVDRSRFIKARFRKFIDLKDTETWDRYFISVLNRGDKQSCILTLRRNDGTTFPVRLESIRFTASDGVTTVRIALCDITDIWQIDALKESEEKYHNLYLNSALGIFHSTFKGRFIDVNPALATLLGYDSPQEVVTEITSISEQVYVEAPHYDAVATAVLKAGGIVSRENCYRRRDGTRWYGKLHLRIVNDHEGRPSHYEGFVEDITERRMVEAALRESEERFRLLLQHVPSVAVQGYNMDGTTRYWNDASENLYGYTAKEAIGKNLVDLIIPPEMRENVRKAITVMGESGEVIPASELSLMRKDGSRVAVFSSHAIVNKASGGMEFFCIDIDLTGRKRVEEELRVSARYTRSLIEASLDPLVTISPEGRITDVNAATEQVTGYSRDHLIGTDFSDYFTEPSVAKEGYRTVFKDGVVLDLPLEIRRRDGKIISVLYNASVYRDESGTVKGVFAAAHDTTEQKRMEEALRLSNKKLNLLSGITRHDINNQLLTLNGFLEYLHRKVKDPDLEDYFTKITRASSRIAGMIQFTREYDSIGVKAPAWQDCRILIDTVAKQAPLGNVIVKNDMPEGMEVFADMLISRVFYNLMDNAVQYGKTITTIRFSVSDGDGGRIIVCEDDGAGIAADEKERIFERGFGKNTGMGLFLSREILAITGITIRETGEPGRGARFEITVPGGALRSADVK